MGLDTQFEQIMKYAPNNQHAFNTLKSAVEKGNVVPFVGAGLAADIYPLWAGALEKLIPNISSGPERKRIESLIKKYKYDDAADAIAEQLTSIFLYSHLLEIFNEEKLNGKSFKSMAAYLLPLIFPSSPVITTNYDRLLERVYSEAECGFEQYVLTPMKYKALKTIQRKLHMLFKVHGDIGRKNVNEHDIIFTKESYDRSYSEGSELVGTLRAFFSGSQMLFLGSSLKYDRTFDVFKDVNADQEYHHFAILPCKKKDLSSELVLFGKKRIMPIFYDPNSGPKYDAVRIILAELLRGIDPDKHARYIDKLPRKAETNANPFLYTTRASEFTGREKELEELLSFAADDSGFRWWTVLGSGGMGKSRLSLELELKLKEKNWNIIRLDEADYRDLAAKNAELKRFSQNLVIADYGQGHAFELGEWMRSLVRFNASKVRLIILERDNQVFGAETLDKQLIRSGEGIRGLVWNTEPLYLEPMDESKLKEIMRSFSLYRGKELAEPKPDELIEVLKSVDKALVRPLYALFITDAVCEGEDPKSWSRTRVLDWVTDREERLVCRNIAKAFDKSNLALTRTQEKALKRLRLIATFHGDIALSELKTAYPDVWAYYADAFDKASSLNNSLTESLNEAGLVHSEKLTALRPDLVGEYFVLRSLDEVQDLLLRGNWADDESRLDFLFRLLNDYHAELAEKRDFLKAFTKGEPTEPLPAFIYCQLLVNISGYYGTFSAVSVETLRYLSEKRFNGDAKFALVYAKGLFNLSCHQASIDEKQKTVDKLRCLSEERFNGDAEIALDYAKGLVNLSNAQASIDEKQKTVDKLRCLSEERFNGDAEIAHIYAMGLFNLSIKQSLLEDMQKTVDKLRCLSEERFNGDAEIAHIYAKGLVSLSHYQESLDDKQKSIDKLRCLSEKRFNGDAEIALDYAKGLVNLSNDQESIEDKQETIDKLRCLSEKRFNGDAEIALAYAMGLFNLSNAQASIDEKQKTIDKLRHLSEKRFNGDAEIALAYATGLFNLSHDQESLDDKQKTVDKLRLLSEVRFNGDAEIAFEYARGLFAQGLAFPETASGNEDTILAMPKNVIYMLKQFVLERIPKENYVDISYTYPRLFGFLIE